MLKNKESFSCSIFPWFFRWATILTVLITILASSSVSASVSPKRISIVYCKDIPPFHFTDENGQPSGIMIDLWRLWSEKTGIPIDFQAASWDETLTRVGSGMADVHAGLFFNKERDKFLDYGTALTKTDTHYFTHTALPQIKEIGGLAPYRVGVIRGDYVEEYLKERLPEGNVVPFSDYDAIMKALQEGTLKVFAADTPTGLFHLSKDGLLPEFTFVSEKPLYQNDFFFAVQDGNKALIEKINQGMALITDEEKRDIKRRWVASGDEKGEAIIISIDRSYAPLTFVNALGRPSGLFVDMWRAWAEKAGRKIKFRASGWAETLDALRAGEVDIHSGLSYSKERAEWIDFSKQIYETFTRVYHRAGDDQPKAIEDYGEHVVGTQFGSYQDAEFRRTYPNVRVRSFATNQDLIDALLKDEIKAIVIEELIMESDLDRLGLRGDISARPERLFPSSIHAGVLKGNSKPLKDINDGFDAIGVEKLAGLEKRWISDPEDRFYKSDTASIELSPDEASWLGDHPVLRVAPDPDFIPIEFFDAQGRYQGLAADFLNLAADRLGVGLEAIHKKNWTQAMAALRSGEADLIGANVPIDEFKKEFLFTEPYFGFHDVIVTHDDIEGQVRLEDLAGKEVMVVKGWPEVHILRDQYPDIKVVEVESTLDALLKIVGKEYGYAYVYFPTASYLIQKHGLAGTRVAGISDDIIPAAAMVRKDSLMLRNLMDKALASITEKERRAIKRRWIPGLSKLKSGHAKPIELNKNERTFLAGHPILRVAMDPDWAPVEFADDQGRFHGISMDYLQQMSELLGIRFEAAEGLTWQEAMAAVEKGDLDLLPSMARTPEREARYDFTNPYLFMPINIFAGGDVTYIPDLEALDRKRVAVVRGYATHEWLRDKHPGIELLPVKSIPAGLKMLASGEAYAFVGNVVTTSYYISKLRLNQIRVVGETPYKYAESMAVRKDWPILAGILQKALNAIPQNERETIFNRWVSVKYEHGFDYSLLWKILIPAFFIVILFFYWNRRLSREVGERKRAEERFQAIAGTTPGAIIQTRFDAAARPEYLYLSAKSEAFFGMPPEQVIQGKKRLQWHPEDQKRIHEEIRTAFSAEKDLNLVGRIQPSGGEVKWIRINASPSRSIEGGLIYNGFILDITERKLAEQEYLKSERKNKAMSQAVDDALIMIDGKGRVMFWNQAAENLFGYTAEEAMGMDFHEMAVPEGDQAKAQAGLESFSRTGQGSIPVNE